MRHGFNGLLSRDPNGTASATAGSRAGSPAGSPGVSPGGSARRFGPAAPAASPGGSARAPRLSGAGRPGGASTGAGDIIQGGGGRNVKWQVIFRQSRWIDWTRLIDAINLARKNDGSGPIDWPTARQRRFISRNNKEIQQKPDGQMTIAWQRFNARFHRRVIIDATWKIS